MCLACEMDAWWFAEAQAANQPAALPEAIEAREGNAATESVTAGHAYPADAVLTSLFGEPAELTPPAASPRAAARFVCEETRPE